MANTTPTPATFSRAVKLVVLFFLRPARFLELQAEDSAMRSAVANRTPIEAALVVRRALFAALLLVIASAATGYALGVLSGRIACASPGTVAWIQIVGTSVLLWGTLFIRGWEIQTLSGVTLTERVNQWIYRGLYCIGTAVLVSSLAVPTCG